MHDPTVFHSCLLHYLQWELATDYNYGTISKFDRAGFLIFGLVFESRDFKVGRNVSCEESTVSPVWGCFLFYINIIGCIFSPDTINSVQDEMT